jgi:hypothetical protein
MSASVLLRGGALPTTIAAVKTQLTASPFSLFNGVFAALATSIAVLKLLPTNASNDGKQQEDKPEGVLSLQRRFLAVFWLVRMSDWMQGPYF